MPTLPTPQKNKQLSLKKFSFNSPLLIGLLVLFAGLGTYAILRSRAATNSWQIPTGREIKIVAFGDSITDNLAQSGSAGKIGEIVTAAGHPANSGAIGIAGSCSTNANGVCGGNPGLLENITAVTGQNPDIVLLNVGTNDFWNWTGPLADGATKPEDPENVPAIVERIGKIVDAIFAANPDSLVLMTHPGEKEIYPRTTTFKTELTRMAAEKSAEGKFSGYVDAYAGMDKNVDFQPNASATGGDNVHITAAGAAKMATNWGNGIVAYIDSIGEPTPTLEPTITPIPTATPTASATPTPSVTPIPTPVPQPTATTGAVLGLYTDDVTYGITDTFDVAVKISTKIPVVSLDATVVFPSDMLQLVGVDLSQPPAFPMKDVNIYLPDSLLNDPGRANGVFTTGLSGTEDPLPAGDYTVMVLHFKVIINTGVADITFTSSADAGKADATSALETNGKGRQLIFISTPTPTNQPTATPTPTNQPTATPSPTPTVLPNDAEANFYLSATPNPVAQNGTVTVTLGANFTKASNAAEVYISYDPTKLEYVSSAKTAAITDIPIYSAENGEVFLVLFKRGELTGNQELATISFKALTGSGSTSLDVLPKSAAAAAADGATMTVSHRPLTLNFGATPTTTPTPTSQPTTTPTPTSQPSTTPTPTPSGKSATLYLTVAPATVNLGDTLTVTLHANVVKAINAGEVYLTFDPVRLQYQSASPLPAITDLPIYSAAADEVFLVLFKRGELTGDNPLVNVTFKALHAGVATIGIKTKSSLADAASGNTVGYDVAGTSVSVNQGPTPQPTANPTPVPNNPTPVPTARPTTRPSTGSTLPTSTRPVNPTQPATNVSPTPVPGTGAASRIVATGIGRNTATITWITGIKTTGVVEYGTTTAYGFTAEQKTLGTEHTVTLPSQVLIPGTTFHYRIKTTDEKAQNYVSSDQTFKTKGYSVVIEVKDQDQKAIKGANVTFGPDLKASTDGAGKASFPDAPGGSVQVKVSYNGQTAEKTVTVTDTATTQTFQVQLGAPTTKKKSSVLVFVIIGIGLILLIGLIIVGIRYMRGNSSGDQYYDPGAMAATPYVPDPNAAPAQGQANDRHEYPW